MSEFNKKSSVDLFSTGRRNELLGLGKNTTNDSKEHPLTSKVLNPHFFSMAQLPSFGKNWLDHFIPNDDMQQLYVTSEVVRNVLMLQ